MSVSIKTSHLAPARFSKISFGLTETHPRVPSHSGVEIRENLENEFPIFQSGTTQGICDSDPEGKGFRQFGVCASCAMSCVQVLF